MLKPIFGLAPIVVLLASGALSQTALPNASVCNVELPLNVVGNTGGLVEGVGLDSVHLNKSKNPMSLQTIDYDKGPRRIVFVIDKTSDVNAGAAKIVDAMLDTILGHARQQDSFAVITSGPVGLRIQFGKKAEAILAQIRQSVPKHDSTTMLDATEEAVGWLGTPNFGAGEYSDVYVGPAGQGLAMTTFSPDIEDWHNLILGTGGHLLQEYTHNPRREYKLTADREKELRVGAWQLYGSVAQAYRVKISTMRTSKSASWELNFSPSAQAKWPGATLSYSRLLPICD